MEITQHELELAERFASSAHQGQFRRDGTTPYVEHARRVAARLDQRTLKAVALLHDVLEDTSATEEELAAAGISREVIDAVRILTKDGSPYESYLERVKSHPIARPVKVADMLDNISDFPTEAQIVKYAKGLLFLLT